LFDNHENIEQYRDEILDYLETQKNSILKKQIRAEKMKRTVYNFQIQKGTEVMQEIMKETKSKEQGQLFLMMKQELSHYSDLRREAENNIDQLEKNGCKMTAFFFHLLNEDIKNLDEEERKLAYLAMFEYIEMPISKEKITIHLRQFMAEIL
jgi:hypothetical protein